MRRGSRVSWILFFSILACGFLILITSSSFQYQSVCKTGPEDRADRELTPVVEGANVLFLPYASIRKALLRGDSSLSSVSFRPAYSGAFILEVISHWRTPVVFLSRGSRLLGLDNQGIVFRLHAPIHTQRVRKIEVLFPLALIPGEPVQPAFSEMVSGLLPILDDVPGVTFSRIILDREEEWNFFTNTGVDIRAGSPPGLLDRLKLLPPILHVLERQKFKTAQVDLRSADQPTLKVIPK